MNGYLMSSMRRICSIRKPNKDQFEAAIFQHLANDILSTIYEASQQDEYEDRPIYDDPHVLIE